MIRFQICLSVLASLIAIALPTLMIVLKYILTDDRSAWYLAKPDVEKPYICKKMQNEACGSSWSAFRGHCYIANDDMKIQSEAQISCESVNSTLVSIHSDAQNQHVVNLCIKLGGNADGADADGWPSCFIGLTQTNVGKEVWAWDDGSAVNFTKWGRARRIVGDFEAVTVNGNWIIGGDLSLISLGINAIVMCGSTVGLLYAVRSRHADLFKLTLGADAICSVMCIATLFMWGLGNSIKDPARNVPLVILCGLQEVATLLILCVQFWFAGFQPKWPVTSTPIAMRVHSTSTCVQPQTVPAREA